MKQKTKQMENRNDMMMVKHEIKQNFGAFSHGRKTLQQIAWTQH